MPMHLFAADATRKVMNKKYFTAEPTLHLTIQLHNDSEANFHHKEVPTRKLLNNCISISINIGIGISVTIFTGVKISINIVALVMV